MPLQFLGKGNMAIEKKVIAKKEEFINLQTKVYSKFYVLYVSYTVNSLFLAAAIINFQWF